MELPVVGAAAEVMLYSPQLAVTGATDTEPATFTPTVRAKISVNKQLGGLATSENVAKLRHVNRGVPIRAA